jgi:hypothetical protein
VGVRRAELSGYVPIKQRDKLTSNTIMVVRHPDHQKYWFTASGGFGALGIAMIATAAALASSTAHLALTGRFMIIAYVAFCCAVACFAGGIRQAPFPFAAGDIDPARVAEPPAIQPASPVQVTFIPEPDTDLLRLVAVNEGDRADFTAQVIGFIDELGRNRTRQTWPIPWEEDGSTTAKEILTYQKRVLNFARFDWSALDEDLRTTKWGSNYHWYFFSTGDPIKIAYSPVRDWRELDDRLFTLKVRVTRADPPGRADHIFKIGFSGYIPTCEEME